MLIIRKYFQKATKKSNEAQHKQKSGRAILELL